MRADIDSLNMVGSEQLTAKLDKLQQLDKEINSLQIESDTLNQQITDETMHVFDHFNNKKMVWWLKQEILGDEDSHATPSHARDGRDSVISEPDEYEDHDGPPGQSSQSDIALGKGGQGRAGKDAPSPTFVRMGDASFITQPIPPEDLKSGLKK